MINSDTDDTVFGFLAGEQIRNVQMVNDGNNVPYERRVVKTQRRGATRLYRPPLPPIAFPTQHLAILGDGAATLFPWGDVVGFHLF